MPWFTKQRKKKARNTSEVRISAVPVSFKVDFGRFWPVLAISVAGQYDPILAELAWFDANWSRFGVNRATSARIRGKKKKKTQM